MVCSIAHTNELMLPLCNIRKYVVLQRRKRILPLFYKACKSYSGMKFILIANSFNFTVTINAARTEVQKCTTIKVV